MRQVNQLRRILLKSALVLPLLPTSSAIRSQAEDTVFDAPASVAEQYLFVAANRERASRGLDALLRDATLTRAAAFHARQMADHADISHEFPGEPDLAARAATAGVRFSLISENVAEAPDSIQIHDMWMESEGHRENLLDPQVNVAGISVIVREGQLYAVEDFASSVEALTIDQQESTVSHMVAAHGIDIASKPLLEANDPITQAARQTCTMTAGFAGLRKPWYVMRYSASTLRTLPPQLLTRIESGKYHQAAVGACSPTEPSPYSSYNIAVMLYP